MPESLLGEKIWLAYGDHNTIFDEAFTAQYCSVIQQYPGENDDWYLVELETPLKYSGHMYEHFLITSRWAGRRVGSSSSTSVFIFPIADVNVLIDPKTFQLKDLIAWGFSARTKEDL